MLKIFQARLQQYMNYELPDVQAGLGRGTRDQIANIHWIIEKARVFQKNTYFCFIDYAKAFDYMDNNKLWKFFKKWECQTTWPASWEICMQVKKQQLELDMKQQTGSKLGKEYVKAVLLPCLFNLYAEYIMWNARLDEAQTGIKIAGRNINNFRYADDTTLMAEREEELKSLLMMKEESEKVGLKLNIQKTKIITSCPIAALKIVGETVLTVANFISAGFKITADHDCSHEINRNTPWQEIYNQPRQHIKKQRHYFANKLLSSQG